MSRFSDSVTGLSAIVVFCLGSVLFCPPVWAEELAHVRFQRELEASGGDLKLPAGAYDFYGTLEVDLSRWDGVSIRADGPVTITMKAPGPAIRLRGTHAGSANPSAFRPETWKERMPLIDGFEILGGHEEADGIELVRTMQATISRMAVRGARHGIRLVELNRNVLISDCHLYHNRGVGLFLDDVNLHQINITSCHISYNQQGGIVVRDGNVRNVHVTGCDIESNMPDDPAGSGIANLLIDQSGRESCSIAEVAITGCTIQHSGLYGREQSGPGGANVRILGHDRHQPNMITVTGNIFSDVTTNIHCEKVMDVTITGNSFFTTRNRDVLLENSQRVILSGNVFHPRDRRTVGGIVFRDCNQVLLAGSTMHHLMSPEGAILLENCEHVRVSQCLLSDSPGGIQVRNSRNCSVTDCSITGMGAAAAVNVDDDSSEIQLREILSVP